MDSQISYSDKIIPVQNNTRLPFKESFLTGYHFKTITPGQDGLHDMDIDNMDTDSMTLRQSPLLPEQGGFTDFPFFWYPVSRGGVLK